MTTLREDVDGPGPGGPPPPLVIAHRGASARFPENTLEAFAGAAALGADWVELDVWCSADGELLVHHDAHLPDGRLVPAIAAADRPAPVPTLDEALAVCAAHGLGVNVEIKSDPGDDESFDPSYRAAALVAERLVVDGPRADGSRRYLVTSFDPGCIERVRSLRPELATGQLVFDVRDAARTAVRAASAGHGAVNPWDPFVDATLLGHARAAGLAVYPWTVDDPDRMRALVALGVDGIITNTPDVLRAILDEG